MDSTLLSSPQLNAHAPKSNWDTPMCAKVRLLSKSGRGYKQIRKETKLPLSSICNIVKSGSSRRTRKGKTYKKILISTRDLQRVFRYVAASWDNRRASMHILKLNVTFVHQLQLFVVR
jgi:hypothetical protein